MGKAIIIPGVDFSILNIGKVTMTSGSVTPVVVPIINISIVSKPSVIENNVQLSISYSPGDTTQKGVTWKSSDESVATVSASGYVTVKKSGNITITVKSSHDTSIEDSFTATCLVSSSYVAVTSINITGNTSGETGTIISLSASVLPENATNNNVTWESSDENVATVNDSGNVTLVSEGSVVITATSVSETNISASHNISVISATQPSGSASEIYNSYISESGRTDTPQLLYMLNELKDGGLLEKIDGLYYLAGSNFNQIKINILNPTGYTLANGRSEYQYIINEYGIKSTGSFAGVLLCKDFKMSLHKNISFGVYVTSEVKSGECVCGFKYGTSNEDLAIFPAKYNNTSIVVWGPYSLVTDSQITMEIQGNHIVSYDPSSGYGIYVNDSGDAEFNKMSANEYTDDQLNDLGILASSKSGSIPASWGTRASLKFAFVSNRFTLTRQDMIDIRTIFSKYSKLL